MAWKDDKNLGPWAFTKQPNKWGYLNNPRWQVDGRSSALDNYDGRESEEPQVWTPFDRSVVRSIGDQETHHKCGHWHKGFIPAPPVVGSCHLDGLSVDDYTDYIIGIGHYDGMTMWQVVCLSYTTTIFVDGEWVDVVVPEEIMDFGDGSVANFGFYGSSGTQYELRFA